MLRLLLCFDFQLPLMSLVLGLLMVAWHASKNLPTVADVEIQGLHLFGLGVQLMCNAVSQAVDLFDLSDCCPILASICGVLCLGLFHLLLRGLIWLFACTRRQRRGLFLAMLALLACMHDDGFGVARVVTVDESMSHVDQFYISFVKLFVRRVLWSDKGYVMDPRKHYIFDSTLGYLVSLETLYLPNPLPVVG